MKKSIVLIMILTILAWCSSSISPDSKSPDLKIEKTCNTPYTIWTDTNQTLNLKAKVVSDNVKNIVSNNAWIVAYLNCDAWTSVNEKTLLAKITPDWSDPNIKNLVNQKKSLETQIQNTKNIISSTRSNFASQLNSLNIQKTNLETQIKLLEQNLAKLEEQKEYWLGDLETQIKTLETQLKDLETSKAKLEESKQADIEKLNKNLQNSVSSASSLINNVLLKIDEIFWITDENRHKNDAFETYLSARNTILKEQIKTEFRNLSLSKPDLNNFSAWTDYLKRLDNLVVLVKESIKDSISSTRLPQTTIDTWYWLFSEYDANVITLKNNIDNLVQSLATVENNYDNQILNLQTQINSTKNNIDNLKANKIGSYTSSIDVQINQTQSQIDSTKSSLENIISQINSLKSQEDIQIKQLENQLSSLNASSKNILTSLATQTIYAGVNWKVKLKKVAQWNKVGPWTLLCQIIPDKSSLKLQVYTNINNQNLWYVSFNINWKECKTDLISKLPYKDPLTQNNIYETSTTATCWTWENIQLVDLLTEWKVLSVKYKITEKQNNKITNSKIFIPLDYVVNKLTGQFVEKITSWDVTKIEQIELWNIDWAYVEVLSWLNIWDTICK